MKGLFPQYNYSDTEGYAEVWKSALFVFDTNVLLNLYRYQTNTRDELLTVIEKLADRIWIPHHVALEFQRNRISVIAEQGKRFNDIRQVVEKAQTNLVADISKLNLQKRHALINPELLISGFDKLAQGFLTELNELEKGQQTITALDPLKTKIEELFENKVGIAYTKQSEIENLNKEAENRYKLKIPPGYKDEAKEKDDLEDFQHEGILYKRKYGDYIVWRQLLAHAENHESKKLIFITDDGKEDWWAQASGKTLGPRPELREEAARVGKLESFLMYKPDGFLRYAKEFLKAVVSEETLIEVRDISLENKNKDLSHSEDLISDNDMYDGVMEWLLERYPRVDMTLSSFPDFIAIEGNHKHAFEIKNFRSNNYRIYRQAIKEIASHQSISRYETTTLIFIANDIPRAILILDILQKAVDPSIAENLHFAIGSVDYVDDSYTFSPIFEAKFSDFTK